MAMIIHINEDRYARILAQGYRLTILDPPKVVSREYVAGDVEYHTLKGEHGICAVCGVEANSVDAESPVDLENIKLALRPH